MKTVSEKKSARNSYQNALSLLYQNVLVQEKTYMTWRYMFSAEQIKQKSAKTIHYTFRCNSSYRKDEMCKLWFTWDIKFSANNDHEIYENMSGNTWGEKNQQYMFLQYTKLVCKNKQNSKKSLNAFILTIGQLCIYVRMHVSL